MPEQTSKSLHHVAILRKGCLFGAIALSVTPNHNAVGSVDYRRSPARILRSFETPQQASQTFHEKVALSHAHGWTVAYNGQPLLG